MVEIYREPINAATRSVKKKKKRLTYLITTGRILKPSFFFFFFLCQHFAFHIIGFTMISKFCSFSQNVSWSNTNAIKCTYLTPSIDGKSNTDCILFNTFFKGISFITSIFQSRFLLRTVFQIQESRLPLLSNLT